MVPAVGVEKKGDTILGGWVAGEYDDYGSDDCLWEVSERIEEGRKEVAC